MQFSHVGMSRRDFVQAVLRSKSRLVVYVAACLMLTGCLGNGGEELIESPPRIEISAFRPDGQERIPFTLIFADADAEREGFPTEIAFEEADNGGPDTATFFFENRTVKTTETRLDLPCFEEPFQVRNDLTGEIAHTQEEFCPRGSWHDDWRFLGLYSESEQVTFN